MIRTLLVDDEPIVRKGLLHILPWNRHGMSVVADLDGGEKALDLLGREPIDLLVTDLTMPGMSGFELIQEAQARFPEVSIAILTCHQEFQYVQEALRIGALDYIVKTEMDDDKLDRIFGRIASRIEEKRVRRQSPAAKSATADKEGALFVAMQSDCSVGELYAVPWVSERMPNPVSDAEQAWFAELPALDKREDGADGLVPANKWFGRWAVVILHHLAMKDRLRELLPVYVRRHIFYLVDRKEGSVVWHDSLRDIMLFEDKADPQDWEEEWDSFRWIADDRAWQELQERIRTQRPEPSALCGVIYRTVRCWRGIRRFPEIESYVAQARTLRVWTDWQLWLARLRRDLKRALEGPEANREHSLRILQSIQGVQRRLAEGITQEEAAASIHFSRGYYSDCFKRTIGVTFNDFMRELRIDRARMWLTCTDVPVHEISRRCGFADEPYFRKLFREETGLAAKEYRAKPEAAEEYGLRCIGNADIRLL